MTDISGAPDLADVCHDLWTRIRAAEARARDLRSALEHIASHHGSAEQCREIAQEALRVGFSQWRETTKHSYEMDAKERQVMHDALRASAQTVPTKNNRRGTEEEAGRVAPEGDSPPRRPLSDRDLWLMREAFKVGASSMYSSMDEWLSDPVSDAGHSVEDAIAHEMRQQARVVCEHGIPDGEFCGHCAMVEV